MIFCGMFIRERVPSQEMGGGGDSLAVLNVKGFEKGSLMETKALKKQLGAAIAMVIVAAIALGAATFAWFVNNSKVTAEGGDYTASSAQYLLISHGDEGDFKTSIAFDKFTGELVPSSTTDATMGTFFQVDSSKTNAWDNSKAKIFTSATASTNGQAYKDSFQLKSDQAGVKVQLKVSGTADLGGLGSAVYVAFTGGKLNKPLVLQLSNDSSVSGGNNTYIGDGTALDGTDSTNHCSTQGIKGLGDNGQVASSNMGALTVSQYNVLSGNVFDFDTIEASENPQEYQMYIWLEGTDPQCYNPIAAKELTGLNFEFTIPEQTQATA